MVIITGLKEGNTIDVEALLSEILKERTTAERFRLDCTPKQAYDMLLAAYMAEVASRRGTFVLTPGLKANLVQISEWLTSDEGKFGLFLCGRSGNGKSTMLRAVRTVFGRFKLDIPLVNARHLVRYAKAYANTTDENWRDAKKYEEAMWKYALAIDDVGTESAEGMVYGEKVSAITDLLYERYDRMLTTFMSSNLAPKEIASVYDARLADRLNEMMTVIDFGHDSSFRTMPKRKKDTKNGTKQ